MSEIDIGIDLGTVETKNFDIADGDYLVQVKTLERKTRKDGEGDYLRLEYLILDSLADSSKGSVGFVRTEIFGLTQNAAWRIKNLVCAALNVTDFKGGKLPDLTEKKFVARLKNEERDGNTNIHIKNMKPVTSWTGKAATPPPTSNGEVSI